MATVRQRLPVTVITGFLGSGKTTLLNRLLRDPAFRNSAVIVNEFGDVGIDHLLIGAARDHIVLLDAGCLCCVMAESLRETLAELYNQRSRGEVPAFDRVFVETSGLADPGPILQTLLKDPLVAPLYEFSGLLCVIDAVNAPDQLHRFVEAREQVALADQIVLTKLDLCAKTLNTELENQLRELNPIAKVRAVPVQNESIAPIFEIDFLFEKYSNFHEMHGHHSSGIISLSFKIPQAVSWAGIDAWTTHLSERFGDDLLRCKGLLNLGQQPGRVVVHGVRRLFEVHYDRDIVVSDRQSLVVLIGRGLDRETVLAGLAWLQAPSGDQQHATREFPSWSRSISKVQGALT